LREIGAVSATVDSAETGAFNPDVVASEAVLPSSEHIPVTRAAGITEVLAVPASGGLDSEGPTGILAGQASAIHLSGWTINDMLLKKSVAMVLNWPEIQTQTFDFSTFTRKQKSFTDAKQEYEKQVDELTDWLDRARHYALALGHGGATDYQRDLKLEALVPVTRGELPVLVFADKARDIRNAVEFCEKQKLKMILAGGAEAYKVKDLLRSKSIPVILGPTLTLPREEDDPYDRLLTQPAELAAAGHKICLRQFRQFVLPASWSASCERRRLRVVLRRSLKGCDPLPRANLRPRRSRRHARERQNRQRRRHQRRSPRAHHRGALPFHPRASPLRWTTSTKPYTKNISSAPKRNKRAPK